MIHILLHKANGICQEICAPTLQITLQINCNYKIVTKCSKFLPGYYFIYKTRSPKYDVPPSFCTKTKTSSELNYAHQLIIKS